MIIEELQAGGWALPKLLPAFEGALSSRLDSPKASEWPIFLKSAVYYKIINSSEITEAVKAHTAINCLGIKFNSKLISGAIPGNKPLPFSERTNVESEKIWFRLNNYNQSLGKLFSNTITNILIVDGCDFKAASTPLIYGCLVVTMDWFNLSEHELALSATHELAHQELFLINTTDRLVAAGGDKVLKYAPLQKTDRPTIGRLHAAHALYRMIKFQESIDHDSSHNKRLLKQTCLTLESNELTVLAKQMIEKVYSQCFI